MATPIESEDFHVLLIPESLQQQVTTLMLQMDTSWSLSWSITRGAAGFNPRGYIFLLVPCEEGRSVYRMLQMSGIAGMLPLSAEVHEKP